MVSLCPLRIWARSTPWMSCRTSSPPARRGKRIHSVLRTMIPQPSAPLHVAMSLPLKRPARSVMLRRTNHVVRVNPASAAALSSRRLCRSVRRRANTSDRPMDGCLSQHVSRPIHHRRQLSTNRFRSLGALGPIARYPKFLVWKRIRRGPLKEIRRSFRNNKRGVDGDPLLFSEPRSDGLIPS
jgi:hypothetical protein